MCAWRRDTITDIKREYKWHVYKDNLITYKLNSKEVNEKQKVLYKVTPKKVQKVTWMVVCNTTRE